MVRIPTDRPPTHPGEALREDFLPECWAHPERDGPPAAHVLPAPQ